MKKIILKLILLLGFVYLTGCDSNSDAVAGILSALKHDEIVDNNLVLIDKVTKTTTTLFITKTTYYIYKNEASELIAIHYNTNVSDKNDYDYSVTIYNNVSSCDVEYVDDPTNSETYYTYQNGKKSESNKYELSDEKTYNVYEEKPLFSKTKYELEETNNWLFIKWKLLYYYDYLIF